MLEGTPLQHDHSHYFYEIGYWIGVGNHLCPCRHDGLPISYDQNDLSEMELYDLFNDVGEKHNVIGEHPNVVKRLEAYAQKARAELGDRLTGQQGVGVRPVGQLEGEGTD